MWDVFEEVFDPDASLWFFYDARQTDPIAFDISITDAPWMYFDYYGGFHMAGEAYNAEDVPLKPYLVGVLYDAEGNILDVAKDTVPVYILPEGIAPFDLTFWGPVEMEEGMFDPTTEWFIYVDYYWTWESYNESVFLNNFTFEAVQDDYGISVTGNVINDSGFDLENVIVVVSVVENATDLLFFTANTWLYDDLLDASNVDFEVDVYSDLSINPDEYTVYLMIVGDVIE